MVINGGWPYFLGNEIKELYITIEEAMGAAKRLGIKTQLEYKTRYKEDPRLPSHPDDYFGDKWPGWPYFLGNEIKELYITVEEAIGAAQRLGIKLSSNIEPDTKKILVYPQTPLSILVINGGLAIFLRQTLNPAP